MRIPDPRRWFHARGRALLIDHGRIGCPVRGDADLESCFACGHMRALSGGPNPRVTCDYRPDDSMAVFARRSG
jgi:hypothetical protein